MKVIRFLTVTMFALFLAGCCCGGRNVIVDSCDPCGGVVAPYSGYSGCSGGCRPWWIFPWNWFPCGCRSCGGCAGGGYGYGDYAMDTSCAGCGMPASAGCGCSQTANYLDSTIPGTTYPSTSAPYIDGSNGGQSMPTLRSAPQPPISAPSTQIPMPPAVPGSESSMYAPRTGSQPQMVSYEEFQRLPGTIISGPGAVAPITVTNAPSSQIQQVSATNQPFLAPPSPSPASTIQR